MSNTANCPTLECCPTYPWIEPVSELKAQLDGLIWAMPCYGRIGVTVFCACFDSSVSKTLVGTAGHVYTVRLRIRGLCEDNLYTGAVVTGTGGVCVLGGLPSPPAQRNCYSLVISDPAATYWLNNTTTPAAIPPYHLGVCTQVDFTFDVQMVAGASVTLYGRGGWPAGDGIQTMNTSVADGNHITPIIITPADTDPPILVTQPYDGEFLQMDVVSIIA